MADQEPEYEYNVNARGEVTTVRNVDDGVALWALTSEGYLWRWEGCDWRLATDKENAEHMPRMQEAMKKAPPPYRVLAPLVSREVQFEAAIEGEREVYG